MLAASTLAFIAFTLHNASIYRIGETMLRTFTLFCSALAIGYAGAALALDDTITATEIAAGISQSKTEMAQEAWWDEHMAGKPHRITGRVKDVEEGSFSGFWVNMGIGRKIDVRCGLNDEDKAIAMNLRKGDRFQCEGIAASTWTAMFGVLFTMEKE